MREGPVARGGHGGGQLEREGGKSPEAGGGARAAAGPDTGGTPATAEGGSSGPSGPACRNRGPLGRLAGALLAAPPPPPVHRHVLTFLRKFSKISGFSGRTGSLRKVGERNLGEAAWRRGVEREEKSAVRRGMIPVGSRAQSNVARRAFRSHGFLDLWACKWARHGGDGGSNGCGSLGLSLETGLKRVGSVA